jgi:glutamate dehydrogenase (NAD(P)+)
MEQELLPPIDQDAEQAFDPYLLRMVELDRMARALDLEAPVLEQMRHAELETTIRLPGIRSDGGASGLSALSSLYEPAAGAIIELGIGPDAHLNQVRASAFLNDLSCALLGLEWRGGSAGVIFDPSQFPERETRRLLRRYCEAAQRILPENFAISCIRGGNSTIHGWLSHDLRQFTSPSGAAARQADTQWERTGRWIAELTRAFTGASQVRTCAIQGGAGLGMEAARALSGGTGRRSGGTRVIMMSDASGAVLNEAGLDLARLEGHLAREQVLFGYAGGEHDYGAELPRCECDLLLLQAPMQITASNAHQVRARIIVECAPDAVSYEAKGRLAESGVEIIPEVLVRCGLVLLAAADSQPRALPEPRVRALLRQSAGQLRAEIVDRAATWRTSPARAALMLAVERRAIQIRRAGF